MELQIINSPIDIQLVGLEGVAESNDYVKKAFELSGRMWDIIKTGGIRNKGMNVWVYGSNGTMFTGVELQDDSSSTQQLTRKTIHLPRHARYKHVGPYHFIRQSGQQMTEELKKRGLETTSPYIEIYGHWTTDESKLETDLLMCLK